LENYERIAGVVALLEPDRDVKAVIETTNGARLQVSFGDETALIYPWQIIIEAR
jgi:hypothetical protein